MADAGDQHLLKAAVRIGMGVCMAKSTVLSFQTASGTVLLRVRNDECGCHSISHMSCNRY